MCFNAAIWSLSNALSDCALLSLSTNSWLISSVVWHLSRRRVEHSRAECRFLTRRLTFFASAICFVVSFDFWTMAVKSRYEMDAIIDSSKPQYDSGSGPVYSGSGEADSLSRGEGYGDAEAEAETALVLEYPAVRPRFPPPYAAGGEEGEEGEEEHASSSWICNCNRDDAAAAAARADFVLLRIGPTRPLRCALPPAPGVPVPAAAAAAANDPPNADGLTAGDAEYALLPPPLALLS